jgi:hypothetical protein
VNAAVIGWILHRTGVVRVELAGVEQAPRVGAAGECDRLGQAEVHVPLVRAVDAHAEGGERGDAVGDLFRALVDAGEHADRTQRRRLDVQVRAGVDGHDLVVAIDERVAAHLDVEVDARLGLLQPFDRVVVAEHRDRGRDLGAFAHVFDAAAGVRDDVRGLLDQARVDDRAQRAAPSGKAGSGGSWADTCGSSAETSRGVGLSAARRWRTDIEPAKSSKDA